MKFLLTGASGFIGSQLLLALIEKYGSNSVVALTSKEIPNVNCVIYKKISDFELEKDCFNDITHVVHSGAFTPKNNDDVNDIELSFSNINYTRLLLSYNFNKLIKFINLSTLDVYAPTEIKLLEGSKIDPVSLYGSSKLYCEKMVKAFSAQRDISYMNLRIGHVYGPGEEKYKKVIPIAIQNILESKPVELWGDGSDLRSFIFIGDVIKSILNSLETLEENLDINVVSGSSVSMYDLLHKVIEVSGKQVQITKIESNHKKRNLIFDNSLLLNILLDKETDFLHGLKSEYEYMKACYENNF